MNPLHEKLVISGAPITIHAFHPKLNMAWCSYPSSVGKGITVRNWLECRDIRKPDFEAYNKEQQEAMKGVRFADEDADKGGRCRARLDDPSKPTGPTIGELPKRRVFPVGGGGIMTKDKHRKRHERLQRAFQELLMDWEAHWLQVYDSDPSRVPILLLMDWAYEQTKSPDHRWNFHKVEFSQE